MTTLRQVVLAAIPTADEETIEHVIWSRTPYPFGRTSARSLFKAASGFSRACQRGAVLCDFCNRQAMGSKFVCDSCDKALSSHLSTRGIQ